MGYAAKTNVNPEKTRIEIERTLTRYGATAFAVVIDPPKAAVMFKYDRWQVRFEIQLPTQAKSSAQLEQATRTKWRALLLVIKAKLESAHSGILTFEQEFLANIVTDDGLTIGDVLLPQLDQVCLTGKPLLMLPPAKGRAA